MKSRAEMKSRAARASKSIQISDEKSNGLYIAWHWTHFMPVQIKFNPPKGRMAGQGPGEGTLYPVAHNRWAHQLMHECINNCAPCYLAESIRLLSDDPTRSRLRSSKSVDVTIPRTKTKMGHRAFQVADPRVWNNLPGAFRQPRPFPLSRNS